MKQAIVLRKDLKLGAGKAAAQASHAALTAYIRADESSREEWESKGQAKIVLKVDSEEQLLDIFMQAKRAKLPCSLITDAGRTQIEPGTKTAVGIGPAEEQDIDKIVGKLKLY